MQQLSDAGYHAGNEELTKSTLVSRNITVKGRRTSVRLEPEMWRALREIAIRESCTIHDICTLISLRKKPRTTLTAAIRVFVMLYFKAATTEEGHMRAGHGSFENMKRRARISPPMMALFSQSKKQQNSIDMRMFTPVEEQNTHSSAIN